MLRSPRLTAGPYIVLALIGLLISLGLIAGLYSARLGFSHLLIFLVVGMAAGVDGPLGLPFSDHALAFGVGNVALALILLDGSLRTPLRAVRLAWAPATTLATLGVCLTATIVMAAAVPLLGIGWRHAALLGAIVSSTDAAAVFSQLANGQVRLPPRLAATVDLESGLNDPMAVLLTVSLVQLIKPADGDLTIAALLARQVGLGLVAGVTGGALVAAVLRRLPLGADHEGLTALLLAASGTVVYALAAMFAGSGFLAIYIFGGVVAHRARGRVRPALLALNGYTWLAEALMFLLLGLLVTPHEVLRFVPAGLMVAGVLMVAARPLSVFLCLTPFGMPWRQELLVSWVGLRGGVPIVLALYPVLAELPRAYVLFDIAFVVVMCSLLLQAPTVGPLARRLGLARSSSDDGLALDAPRPRSRADFTVRSPTGSASRSRCLPVD
jgi:potassium/hydrogen antiporter